MSVTRTRRGRGQPSPRPPERRTEQLRSGTEDHRERAANAGKENHMRDSHTAGALVDGEYWATCRERNALAAALNGLGSVFPQARLMVRDGWATVAPDGQELWGCNAQYAAAHFQIQRA